MMQPSYTMELKCLLHELYRTLSFLIVLKKRLIVLHSGSSKLLLYTYFNRK